MAEGGGKRITKRGRDGTITTVIDNHAGTPMLAPNDLIVDSKGGIYFTDPGPRPVVAGRPTYVSYLAPGARQSIIVDDKVPRPNGLTLTRDGRTLIVDDTLGPMVFAYDVQPDGTVRNKRTFTQLRDIPAGMESGADGLALDNEDRVYITTVAGVQVFDSKGQYLGAIKSARQGANVAFAGPGKQTLYITAREGLYRVRTLAKGPDRWASKGSVSKDFRSRLGTTRLRHKTVDDIVPAWQRPEHYDNLGALGRPRGRRAEHRVQALPRRPLMRL